MYKYIIKNKNGKVIFEGNNLRGANLTGADLKEANLSYVDLTGADLRWADLREADLREANLRGADLRRTRGKRFFSVHGSRQQLLAVDGYIRIGCAYGSLEYWLIAWDIEGREHKYTEAEQKEYRGYIRAYRDIWRNQYV